MIPVYRNRDNIPALLAKLEALHRELRGLEIVFVVDGSPDDSWLQLSTRLAAVSFPAQLLALSRNFGTFAAMRAGLTAARGEYFAVMAADLQEPLELIVEFDRILRAGEHDLAVGQRTARQDPLLTRVLARTYWRLYRRFVQPEIPEGGVDIFACRRLVRDHLLGLGETNSSLIGLLFWVGFRRATVPYARQKRLLGRSAWTLPKRLRYLADSVFGFTDLPIRLLYRTGIAGLAVSVVLALLMLLAELSARIALPRNAGILLAVIFFGGLNSLGLGIIGGYVWRAFENTKQRPGFIVASHSIFPGTPVP